MSHLVVVSAAGSSQRRLLLETLDKARKDGYEVTSHKEGGLWSDYFEEAMTAGLFCSRSVVVVEDSSRLGSLPDKFINLIEGPESDSLFVLVYDGDHKKYLSRDVLKVSTLIEAEKIPHWPSQRVKWLIDLARDRGFKLGRDGASLMVEWIEDPEELRSELFKLASQGDGKIDSDLVKGLVLNEGGRGMLKLLDGFCSKRASLCIDAMLDLRDGDEMIPVLSALHKRIRAAWYVTIWGGNRSVESGLGLTPYQARQASEASRLYNRDVLRDLLAGTIKISMAERLGSGEGWAGLERLLLSKI